MEMIIIAYILFGIGLATSSRTNLVPNSPWYIQLLFIVAYPLFIYAMVVKVCLLAIKLTEQMDEIKNEKIRQEEAMRGLRNMASPLPKPIVVDDDDDEKDDDAWLTIKVREGSYVVTPDDAGIVLYSLNQQFMILVETLARKDLGDIEREQTEKLLSQAKRAIHKINNS